MSSCLSPCSSHRWTDSNYKGKTYLPLSTAADKVVTSVGERDEQRTLAGTWTSCSSSNSPGRSREAPSSYRSDYQSQHTSDIYDITSSSGRPVLSHSYPYPHPSPYSHLKSNTAAFSQPQSQSYSQPRFGGGGGDGRGNDNGSGSLQTYRSPFRDSSALRDRNESP